MEFDRVRNEEQRKIRVEQIKNAAIKLLDTEPFHEILLAKIANETSFTRGNLYKYVSSKEEIYLLVLLDEVHAWIGDLAETFKPGATYELRDFSLQWAQALYRHQRFLKLGSLLFNVIEQNVSLDSLVQFKKQFADILASLQQIVRTVFPAWDDPTIQKFIQLQLHHAIGLYPAASPSPLQKEAIELAGIPYQSPDFVEEFAEFIEYTVGYLKVR